MAYLGMLTQRFVPRLVCHLVILDLNIKKLSSGFIFPFKMTMVNIKNLYFLMKYFYNQFNDPFNDHRTLSPIDNFNEGLSFNNTVH